jgi:hypothetical protein
MQHIEPVPKSAQLFSNLGLLRDLQLPYQQRLPGRNASARFVIPSAAEGSAVARALDKT